MKNTKAQVSMPTPCSKNWNDMEQNVGYNFCQDCSSPVIDFTTYSNAEILETLSKSASTVCGRLSESQLAQLNYHLVVAPANRNWMKYLGVLAIGVSIFAQNVHASSMPKVKTEMAKSINSQTDDKKPLLVKKISGRIFGPDKKPLAGIRVVIIDTKYVAMSDKNGAYEIKFQDGIDIKNNILSVQSARYTAELALDFSKEKQADLNIQKLDKMILGKMIYTPTKAPQKL